MSKTVPSSPVEAATKCFACDRPLGRNPMLADTRDGQLVFVGSDCFAQIQFAAKSGQPWQPKKGGPCLFLAWFCLHCGEGLEYNGDGVPVYACNTCRRMWPARTVEIFASRVGST